MTGFAKRWIICAAVAALLSALPASAGIAVAQNNPPAADAPAAATPATPPQPPPPARPGFLHQLKVWWSDSATFIDGKIKDTRGYVDDLGKKSGEATPGAADAAKDATTDTTKDAAKDAVQSAATATQNAMQGAVEATKGAAATAQDAMKSAVEATKNAATAIVKLPNTRLVEVHERCAKAPNGAPDCEAAAAAGCRGKGFAGGHPLDVRTMEKCDSTAMQAGQIPGQRECPVEAVVSRAVCQ
jgi:hypothetical protein